jgi:hypothetical protein
MDEPKDLAPSAPAPPKPPRSLFLLDLPGRGTVRVEGNGKFVAKMFRRLWLEIEDDLMASIVESRGRLVLGPLDDEGRA